MHIEGKPTSKEVLIGRFEIQKRRVPTPPAPKVALKRAGVLSPQWTWRPSELSISPPNHSVASTLAEEGFRGVHPRGGKPE